MSTPTNGPGPEGQPGNNYPQNGYPQQGGQGYPPQGGQQGYYQEPPKKKRKKWPWIVGILALLLLLLFAGCATLIGGAAKSVNDSIQSSAPTEEGQGDGDEEPASADSKVPGSKDQLKITTTATEAGSVSYGSGGSMSTGEFATEWTKTVTAKRMDFFTVTVQDKSGAPDAKVTCALTRDGKKTDEQNATGAYAVATCTDSY